jgi:hypothetical protein
MNSASFHRSAIEMECFRVGCFCWQTHKPNKKKPRPSVELLFGCSCWQIHNPNNNMTLSGVAVLAAQVGKRTAPTTASLQPLPICPHLVQRLGLVDSAKCLSCGVMVKNQQKKRTTTVKTQSNSLEENRQHRREKKARSPLLHDACFC